MNIRKIPLDALIAENERRKQANAAVYDPVSGLGASGERVPATSPAHPGTLCHLPATMIDDPRYATVGSNAVAWQKLRFEHDFEYWAATAVRIKDKISGRDVPLILNRPQRHVLAVLERQRLAGQPLRIIVLKARQWGGSTLVQMYMAWIQSVLRLNWHSLICAHVKDSAAQIRGMYTRMLDNYPPQLWTPAPSADDTGDQPAAPRFKPFERSLNTREIVGRGCRVTVGSSESQEAVRGADLAMAHLSEAAFWGNSTRRSPDDFIRAVCSGIMLEPLTLIAVESTANGVGNWFHREWLRAEKGQSDKTPVFVPWYMIDIYEQPLPRDGITDVVASLTDYECALWEADECVTLEKLLWYHRKAREYPMLAQMHAEFPSNPLEAFTSSGKAVFDMFAVNRLREACPDRADLLHGEICRGRFVADSTGHFSVVPDALQTLSDSRSAMMYRYVVGVDVGGRSKGSDRTVITVLDRIGRRDVPEFVAQWCGHCDYDILVHKAIAVARMFNNALLVIESNTLEHAEAVSGLGILTMIAREYNNVYHRRAYDEITDRPTRKIGFHTNRATKLALIAGLQSAVREGAFLDNFVEAVDEFATYEEPSPGVFAAAVGCHDDMLMARAIALEVARTLPAPRSPETLAPINSWRF